MQRKFPLATGEFYHVYTRSIASFKLLKHPHELTRMRDLLRYYSTADSTSASFSIHLRTLRVTQNLSTNHPTPERKQKPSVRIIAYCLMPTHLHLLIQQTEDFGISNFMRRVLDGYSKFFNALHKRKGPLWDSRFQNRHVDCNDYLLHLSRYIHLNPVEAGMVARPQDWEFSSYRNYIGSTQEKPLADFKKLIPYPSQEYKKITEDHLGYQDSLGKIGHLLIDNPKTP